MQLLTSRVRPCSFLLLSKSPLLLSPKVSAKLLKKGKSSKHEKQALPRWRCVESLMGGLEGADDGDVAHDDDKEAGEDNAGNQDGERNRGGVR